MFPSSSLYILYLVMGAAFTLGAAIIALAAKEDVYAALGLGLVGVGVAALIALLGYGIISVFHILVYVGATVTFVVFSVLLIGRGVGWERRLLPPALATAALIGVAYFASMYVLAQKPIMPVNIGLGDLGAEIFGRHLIAVIFLAFALASVMIEGVLIASKQGEE